MLSIGSTLAMMIAAVIAAFACVITVVGAMQLTASRRHGYFHFAIPLMLLTTAVATALSGRSIDLNGTQLAIEGMLRHPAAIWAQRISSILILTVAAERIISHFSQQKSLLGAAPALTLCFIAFWLGGTASPMLLSAYPDFSHDSVYTLVIGVAALLLKTGEAELTLLTARNALLVFLLAGYLMLAISPAMVLDLHYTQGLVPGLPRFAGLAPHAVTQGMLALLALLCLWARPFDNRHLNRLAWAVGMLTLLLAQSKTSWISFSLCALVMYTCQHGQALRDRLNDPEQPHLGIALTATVLVLLASIAIDAMFGSLGQKFDHFLSSDSGAQLTSLTGRDIIWATAYEEWLRHPVFGYGPHFLDESYRLSIGLPTATHGHNQYMDMLPRAGLAGAIPLTLYLFALLFLSVRHAAISRGLTLALFLALGLRAISEVPLTLSGYGSEFTGHLLLLVLLPACNMLARQRSTEADGARTYFAHAS